MTQRLLIATGNRHKAGEIAAMLVRDGAGEGLEIVTTAEFPGLPEPDENGATFLENAIIKAHAYARATGLPALADDSGLVVDQLDGRPGVRSARYAATNDERIARVLGELKAAGPGPRSARFVCVAALALPTGEVFTSEGRVEGVIAGEGRGEGGFGYDPIFIPLDPPTEELRGRSFAEYPPEAKNAISHRGRAMRGISGAVSRIGAGAQESGGRKP